MRGARGRYIQNAHREVCKNEAVHLPSAVSSRKFQQAWKQNLCWRQPFMRNGHTKISCMLKMFWLTCACFLLKPPIPELVSAGGVARRKRRPSTYSRSARLARLHAARVKTTSSHRLLRSSGAVTPMRPSQVNRDTDRDGVRIRPDIILDLPERV